MVDVEDRMAAVMAVAIVDDLTETLVEEAVVGACTATKVPVAVVRRCAMTTCEEVRLTDLRAHLLDTMATAIVAARLRVVLLLADLVYQTEICQWILAKCRRRTATWTTCKTLKWS